MLRPKRSRNGSRPEKRGNTYVVIVRGPDGQPRVERFADAAAYRAKLMSMTRSDDGGISIEDIVELLDI
jgi:hypothetical protein